MISVNSPALKLNISNYRNTVTVGIYYGIPALQVVFAKALAQQMVPIGLCSQKKKKVDSSIHNAVSSISGGRTVLLQLPVCHCTRICSVCSLASPLKEGHCSCNCGAAIEFVLPLVQRCQQCLEQQWICCLGNDVCCHCCHSVRIWMGVVHKAEIASHSQPLGSVTTVRNCALNMD